MSNFLTREWHRTECLADQLGTAEAYGFAHAYRIAIDHFGTGPLEVSPEDILSNTLAIMADPQPVPYNAGEALGFLRGFNEALLRLVDSLKLRGSI